jgi:hypothetical protein
VSSFIIIIISKANEQWKRGGLRESHVLCISTRVKLLFLLSPRINSQSWLLWMVAAAQSSEEMLLMVVLSTALEITFPSNPHHHVTRGKGMVLMLLHVYLSVFCHDANCCPQQGSFFWGSFNGTWIGDGMRYTYILSMLLCRSQWFRIYFVLWWSQRVEDCRIQAKDRVEIGDGDHHHHRNPLAHNHKVTYMFFLIFTRTKPSIN